MTPPSVVLTAWSATTAYGVGGDTLATGLSSGLPAPTATGPHGQPVHQVTGLDVDAQLGRKAARSLDRATGIAVVTIGSVLEVYKPQLEAEGRRVGVVLGTGSGSLRSSMQFTGDSLRGKRPYQVDPAQFPNTVMNRAAAQAAIHYGLRGPNVTVAGGALSGLHAFAYAARLCRADRCDVAVCGAVEEYSEQREWVESRAGTVDTGVLGEGAAAFQMETEDRAVHAGHRPIATVVAIRFGAFADPGQLRVILTRCLGQVLSCQPDDLPVAVVATSEDSGPLGEQERAAIADVLGTRPGLMCIADMVGNTASATAAIQVAAVMANVPGQRQGPSLALVTAVDPSGTAGCTLLHLRGEQS